eukprot:4380094-Pyramimonas_sp.AAC.1
MAPGGLKMAQEASTTASARPRRDPRVPETGPRWPPKGPETACDDPGTAQDGLTPHDSPQSAAVAPKKP